MCDVTTLQPYHWNEITSHFASSIPLLLVPIGQTQAWYQQQLKLPMEIILILFCTTFSRLYFTHWQGMERPWTDCFVCQCRELWPCHIHQIHLIHPQEYSWWQTICFIQHGDVDDSDIFYKTHCPCTFGCQFSLKQWKAKPCNY